MWEVSCDGKDFVFEQHQEAREKAREAAKPGCRVSVRRCKTDVLIVDPESQTIVQVNTKMPLKTAAKWAYAWSQANRRAGCLLWPHGRALPDGWNVVQADQLPELGQSAGLAK